MVLAGMNPDLDAEELMKLGVNLGIAVMIIIVVLYFSYWIFNLTRRRSEIWKRLLREQ